MSSKQKIAISAIGIVLVLAIIGLTIGLVLVASQASATNSMKVTYSATNVACTIQGSAKSYDLEEATVETTHVQSGYTDPELITANVQDSSVTGNINFATVDLENAEGYVVYEFVITNTATAGASAIKATATITESATKNNIAVVVGTDRAAAITAATAADPTNVLTATTADIPAAATGNSATLYVVVAIDDGALEATFEDTTMSLVVTQA